MRVPVVTIIIVAVLSVLVDWYIHSDLKRFCRCRSRKKWIKIYDISSVVCWVFLVVTLCLPRRSVSDGILPVMWMLYTYLTIYVSKAVYVIFSLIGRIFVRKTNGRNFGIYLGVPLGLLVFIMMWWGVLLTRHEIRVEKVTVESPKIPEAFDGYRIVQFSDAHVGTWGNDTTFISALCDTINSLDPDLIVFTGDIVNRETSELKPFINTFSRLKARDGVYSILGNHDYGDYITWEKPSLREANNRLLADWEKQMGWRLLNNEHAWLVSGSDSIALIGVENWGEPPFHQYGDLQEAYPAKGDSVHSLNDRLYKILLSHNPEHWNREVTDVSNIDLTLSGHTHAMQFQIGLGDYRWSPAKYRYDQWGGMYERSGRDGNPMKIYVNIGSGEVGMPARIGTAYPEVTMLTLRHKK